MCLKSWRHRSARSSPPCSTTSDSLTSLGCPKGSAPEASVPGSPTKDSYTPSAGVPMCTLAALVASSPRRLDASLVSFARREKAGASFNMPITSAACSMSTTPAAWISGTGLPMTRSARGKGASCSHDQQQKNNRKQQKLDRSPRSGPVDPRILEPKWQANMTRLPSPVCVWADM